MSGESFGQELVCYRGDDTATLVCGDCGTPLCADHARDFRDSTFSRFESGSPLVPLLGVLFLFVVPAVVTSLPSSTVSELDAQLPVQGTGVEMVVLLASVLLGGTLLLGTWIQRGDGLVAVGFPTRNAQVRHLCEECYGDTRGQRVTYYAVLVLALGLLAGGVGGAVVGPALAVVAVAGGVGIYLLRDDLVLYLVGGGK